MHKTVFGVYPGNSVHLIIDGSHVYHMTRNLGWDLDWDKLRAVCTASEYDVRHMHYFQSYVADEEGNPLNDVMGFLFRMRINGFEVHAKPLVRWNQEGRTFHSNNNVEVAVQLVQTSYQHPGDDIVLFAGARDLVPALTRAKQNGARVTLVSSLALKGQVGAMSDALRIEASAFFDLQDLRKVLEREPSERLRHREPIRMVD